MSKAHYNKRVILDDDIFVTRLRLALRIELEEEECLEMACDGRT